MILTRKYKKVVWLCLFFVLLLIIMLFHKQVIEPRVYQTEEPDVFVQKYIAPNGLPEKYQIPSDAELARMNETSLMHIYWKYINMLHILCTEVIRLGKLSDGGKEVCVDDDYRPKSPCLVYSFGINNKFDFDEAVVEMFGCEVHSFDPSMQMKTRRISEKIWFYNWGLGGNNYRNSKNWEIKTLDSIKRALGHTYRTIDILKMDIEGAEWSAIPQMISSGALYSVRQIALETHFGTTNPHKGDDRYWGNLLPHKQLSSLRQLYDYGFRTFMRERNLIVPRKKYPGIKGFVTNVNEVSMIMPV